MAKKIRVLMVDDEKDIYEEFINNYKNDPNIEFVYCQSPKEALSLLQNGERFNLITSDIFLTRDHSLEPEFRELLLFSKSKGIVSVIITYLTSRASANDLQIFKISKLDDPVSRLFNIIAKLKNEVYRQQLLDNITSETLDKLMQDAQEHIRLLKGLNDPYHYQLEQIRKELRDALSGRLGEISKREIVHLFQRLKELSEAQKEHHKTGNAQHDDLKYKDWKEKGLRREPLRFRAHLK